MSSALFPHIKALFSSIYSSFTGEIIAVNISQGLTPLGESSVSEPDYSTAPPESTWILEGKKFLFAAHVHMSPLSTVYPW